MNPTIFEDPEYWPDTCPQYEDDWTEEEEEAWNHPDDFNDTDEVYNEDNDVD